MICQLAPGSKLQLAPPASLLRDLMRIDGAIEMRQRFEHRAGGAVRRHPDLADGGKQFVCAPPFQVDGIGSERQGAGMKRDIDIARAADDFVGLDGNRSVGRKREGEDAIQEPRHHRFLAWREQRRRLGNQRRQRQRATARHTRGRCGPAHHQQ
jgi:hypothetical protein